MKFFRSHIAQVSGFWMLVLGMVLHFAKPAEGKTCQNAFTSWLGSHLKTEDRSVLDKLNAIASAEEQVESIIHKASELVFKHSDDFELPPSVNAKNSSKEEVYDLLLSKWRSYQHSNSEMGKAVLIQNIKPQTIIPTDGNFFASLVSKKTPYFDADKKTELNDFEISPKKSFFLSALESGTAIGAP